MLANSLDVLGYDFVDNDLAPDEEANGLDDDGDGRVDELYGHGTHVAGIVHLVAPDARLLPLRVLNSDGRGNNFRTASAIVYATHRGADAINLSLGTPHQSAAPAGGGGRGCAARRRRGRGGGQPEHGRETIPGGRGLRNCRHLGECPAIRNRLLPTTATGSAWPPPAKTFTVRSPLTDTHGGAALRWRPRL